MKIYLRHVKPLGFKGSDMFEDSAWHHFYYRVFYDQCAVVGIDALTPGVWMVELTPKQMKRYKANKLSITPPGCCAPCAGEREVVEVNGYVYEGPINSQKHLKQILDKTGLFDGSFVGNKLLTAKQVCESLKKDIEDIDERVRGTISDLKDLNKQRYDLCQRLKTARRHWNRLSGTLV